MRAGFRLWKDHLSAYAAYLGIVGGGVHDADAGKAARDGGEADRHGKDAGTTHRL